MRGAMSFGFSQVTKGSSKGCFSAITKMDEGGGIEEAVSILVARIKQAHPKLVAVLPLEPKPLKPQRTGKSLGVEYTMETKHFGRQTISQLTLLFSPGVLSFS